MFQRVLRRKPAPELPRETEPRWRRQLNSIIETQIARYPFLVQVRAVWRQLREEQGRPVLIPILLLLFVAFYRAERRKVRAEIAQKRRADATPR